MICSSTLPQFWLCICRVKWCDLTLLAFNRIFEHPSWVLNWATLLAEIKISVWSDMYSERIKIHYSEHKCIVSTIATMRHRKVEIDLAVDMTRHIKIFLSVNVFTSFACSGLGRLLLNFAPHLCKYVRSSHFHLPSEPPPTMSRRTGWEIFEQVSSNYFADCNKK